MGQKRVSETHDERSGVIPGHADQLIDAERDKADDARANGDFPPLATCRQPHAREYDRDDPDGVVRDQQARFGKPARCIRRSVDSQENRSVQCFDRLRHGFLLRK